MKQTKKFCGACIFDLLRFFFIRMMIDTFFEDNLSYIMNIILSFSKPGDLLLVEQTMMMMDIGLSVYSSFVSNVCYQVDSFFFFFFFLFRHHVLFCWLFLCSFFPFVGNSASYAREQTRLQKKKERKIRTTAYWCMSVYVCFSTYSSTRRSCFLSLLLFCCIHHSLRQIIITSRSFR